MICEATSVRSSVGFKISALVRQSSVTSNTLWARVNFFGQMTVQRYVVLVSTVELRTLYIQELPYMNTFCECILKKIGPTHANFQYKARKLMSLKSVLLWGKRYSSRKLSNGKAITTACNIWRQIACSFQVMSRNILILGKKKYLKSPHFLKPGQGIWAKKVHACSLCFSALKRTTCSVQPRSQSSSAISDVTSPTKLVGKIRQGNLALSHSVPSLLW